MSKFDKFLDEEETQAHHISLQRKRQLQEQNKSKEKAKFRSIKISEEDYQLLNLLKMTEGGTYVSVLHHALKDYTDTLAEEHPHLRNMRSVLSEAEERASGQMNIDDFL